MSLILNEEKTIELRKKIGKNFVDGSTIIIYSSSPVKSIVAIAKINKIQRIRSEKITEEHLKKIFISDVYFKEYMINKEVCYLIELKDVKKLKKPIHLQELKEIGFTAPQSFCYASELLQTLVNSKL